MHLEISSVREIIILLFIFVGNAIILIMADKETSQSSSAWGFRKMLGLGNSSTTQDKAKMTDRYSHDMAQADLMRGDRKSTNLTERDIQLALKGLEEAQSLKEEGSYDESLKISELSLEILIQFLKNPSQNFSSLDREWISQRVHVALTDAEQLKQQQKSGDFKTSKTQSPSNNTKTTTKKKKTTKKKASKASSSTLANNLTSAVQKLQPTGQSTASQEKRKSVQKSAKSKSPSKRTLPSADSSMVQTVKSELYVDPSQLQDVSWDDIAGLDIAKQSLQENAILPMIRPDLFTGLRKPRNILLYGPPGTGKTMLVKAVARESNCLLFVCTASALTSKWHGESEKLLRTLFQVARAATPSIIFCDEMDALLGQRKSDGEHEASRRFKTEFMTQVDGIVQNNSGEDDGKHLLLIACTNCPWDIDAAVMRRFPRRIHVPLPDSKARKALLKHLLTKAGKHSLSAANITTIVKRMEGFSGSDMSAIASEASFGPIRALGGIGSVRQATAKEIRPISYEDFDQAIRQATRSVSKQQIAKYEEWRQEQAAS